MYSLWSGWAHFQKCFKIYGYPHGYIPGYKSSNPSHGQLPKGSLQFDFAPRGHSNFNIRSPSQFTYCHPSMQQSHQYNVVTNIMAAPYLLPPATNTVNIDFSQMNQDQIQILIH